MPAWAPLCMRTTAARGSACAGRSWPPKPTRAARSLACATPCTHSSSLSFTRPWLPFGRLLVPVPPGLRASICHQEVELLSVYLLMCSLSPGAAASWSAASPPAPSLSAAAALCSPSAAVWEQVVQLESRHHVISFLAQLVARAVLQLQVQCALPSGQPPLLPSPSTPAHAAPTHRQWAPSATTPPMQQQPRSWAELAANGAPRLCAPTSPLLPWPAGVPHPVKQRAAAPATSRRLSSSPSSLLFSPLSPVRPSSSTASPSPPSSVCSASPSSSSSPPSSPSAVSSPPAQPTLRTAAASIAFSSSASASSARAATSSATACPSASLTSAGPPAPTAARSPSLDSAKSISEQSLLDDAWVRVGQSKRHAVSPARAASAPSTSARPSPSTPLHSSPSGFSALAGADILAAAASPSSASSSIPSLPAASLAQPTSPSAAIDSPTASARCPLAPTAQVRSSSSPAKGHSDQLLRSDDQQVLPTVKSTAVSSTAAASCTSFCTPSAAPLRAVELHAPSADAVSSPAAAAAPCAASVPATSLVLSESATKVTASAATPSTSAARSSSLSSAKSTLEQPPTAAGSATAAVTIAALPDAPAAHEPLTTRVCASCSIFQPKTNFSGTQLKKQGRAICKACALTRLTGQPSPAPPSPSSPCASASALSSSSSSPCSSSPSSSARSSACSSSSSNAPLSWFSALLASPQTRFYPFACDKCDAQLFGCGGEHRGEYCGACGELTFYNKAKSREELYDAGVPLYCSIDCPDNHPHPHACGDRCWNPFCFMTLRPDVDPSCPAPPPHNQPRSCSQCGVVSYCSSECEEEDRAQHAPECACYALKRTAVGTDQR